MVFEFQIYQRHEEQYGSTHVRTHTHIVLARVQYEENRPAHLVLHTRDKQLKSAPHAGHQSMCCHICSGSTVSKGPEDRPKKISHWPQCHSVDTRLKYVKNKDSGLILPHFFVEPIMNQPFAGVAHNEPGTFSGFVHNGPGNFRTLGLNKLAVTEMLEEHTTSSPQQLCQRCSWGGQWSAGRLAVGRGPDRPGRLLTPLRVPVNRTTI